MLFRVAKYPVEILRLQPLGFNDLDRLSDSVRFFRQGTDGTKGDDDYSEMNRSHRNSGWEIFYTVKLASPMHQLPNGRYPVSRRILGVTSRILEDELRKEVQGRRGPPNAENAVIPIFAGDPGGSRTPNPQIRSLMLYPVELRGRPRKLYHFWRSSGIPVPVSAQKGRRIEKIALWFVLWKRVAAIWYPPPNVRPTLRVR